MKRKAPQHQSRSSASFGRPSSCFNQGQTVARMSVRALEGLGSHRTRWQQLLSGG